jgi:uncharacterized protein with HEPN domain
MSNRLDIDYIDDILFAIERIEEYSLPLQYEDFLTNNLHQDAIIRNIEIIGEAVKNLSNVFKDEFDEISWSNIAGTRDKLIHHYFGINYDIVWNIIREDLPVLKKKLMIIKNQSA